MLPMLNGYSRRKVLWDVQEQTMDTAPAKRKDGQVIAVVQNLLNSWQMQQIRNGPKYSPKKQGLTAAAGER